MALRDSLVADIGTCTGSRRRFTPIAAILTLLMAGCANPAADNALFAQSALVGMPKRTLLSCAGVPDRQAAVDNMEYFTYRSQRLESYPGSVGMSFGGWRPGFGFGYGFPLSETEVRSTTCEATVTLRNGVVDHIVYGGGTGGGDMLGQCYVIVRNCLALLPPAKSPPPG